MSYFIYFLFRKRDRNEDLDNFSNRNAAANSIESGSLMTTAPLSAVVIKQDDDIDGRTRMTMSQYDRDDDLTLGDEHLYDNHNNTNTRTTLKKTQKVGKIIPLVSPGLSVTPTPINTRFAPENDRNINFMTPVREKGESEFDDDEEEYEEGFTDRNPWPRYCAAFCCALICGLMVVLFSYLVFRSPSSAETKGVDNIGQFPTPVPTPPTMLPTLNPTLPTMPPTLNPTDNPTLFPTVHPSLSPTVSPSTSPTSSPTRDFELISLLCEGTSGSARTSMCLDDNSWVRCEKDGSVKLHFEAEERMKRDGYDFASILVDDYVRSCEIGDICPCSPRERLMTTDPCVLVVDSGESDVTCSLDN